MSHFFLRNCLVVVNSRLLLAVSVSPETSVGVTRSLEQRGADLDQALPCSCPISSHQHGNRILLTFVSSSPSCISVKNTFLADVQGRWSVLGSSHTRRCRSQISGPFKRLSMPMPRVGRPGPQAYLRAEIDTQSGRSSVQALRCPCRARHLSGTRERFYAF